MNIKGNTILITGGASGIGLALAERFIKSGNKVIIVGRRPEKLAEAKEKFPQLLTGVCDVSVEEERLALFKWVTTEFPELNVLVNNAGIQQRVNLLNTQKDWAYYGKEIAINLEGPIHLTMLFLPHLKEKSDATIINISSGLAFMPGAWVPIYSATKAALHSFTLSLRLQLEKTPIKLIEVFPPAVNTDLGGVGLHTFGTPLADFADAVFMGFKNGDSEIGYGGTEKRLHSTNKLEQGSKQAWENFVRHNPDFLN